MGQAFDGKGNVIGETFGETKREVLEKLEAAHKDAAEIRIRTLSGDNQNRASVSVPEVEPMMQFFEFAHLPEHLRGTSIRFYEVACALVATLPRNPERTVALRKLLEAKDCAVRSLLYNSGSTLTVGAVAGQSA